MAEYINREQLLELINEDCKYKNSTNEYTRGCNDVCDWAIKVIKNIPATDVQKVRHGKWIEMERGHYFKCSECRNPIPYRFGWMSYNNVIKNNIYYNYCPNCGARMDGDKK